LVPAGFIAGGLRGACAGLLASEVVVLGIGLWWTRDFLGREFLDMSRRHLSPFLRLGTLFGAANLLMTFTQRSGEAMVRFASGSYEEVGYFGAAYAIYLTAAHALWQVVVSLAPHFIAEADRGNRDRVARWLERLLAYAVSGSVLCLAGALFAGRDLVLLLLGRQYAAVAENLLPLMVTLTIAGAAAAGRVVALVVNRPRPLIAAAGLELAVYLLAGIPLAVRFGSFGASVATIPASAAFAWYLTVNVRRSLPYGLGPARRAVGAAAVFLPLAFLRDGWVLNLALLAAGAGAYVAVLVRCRAVAASDLRNLRRLLRGTAAAPDSVA
jgi:O-antigen/teichoic acid export membrane protein